MADGAVNQSMDEILAQIRKIIAEDAPTGKPQISLTGAASPPPTLPQTAIAAPAHPIPPVPAAALADPVAVPLKSEPKNPSVVNDLMSDLVDIESDAPVAKAPSAAIAVAAPPTPSPALVAKPSGAAELLDDLAESPEQPVAPVVRASEPEVKAVATPISPPVVAISEVPKTTAQSADVQIEAVASIATPETVTVEQQADVTVPAPVVEPPVAAAPVTPIAATEPTTPIVPPVHAPTLDVMLPVADVIIPTRAVEAPVAETPKTPAATVSPEVITPPVTLSTLFANRIDGLKSPSPGIALPTHIGLSSRAPTPAPVPTPNVPAAPTSALGALAAGLAASGLAAATPEIPVAPIAATPPPPPTPASVDAPAPVVTPPAEKEPAAETSQPTTDQIMDAMRPILTEWLADNLPRALEGPLRDALPDLVAKARDAAARKRA